MNSQSLPRTDYSFSGVLRDLKAEVGGFVQTRVQMFKRELDENLTTLKVALPLAALATVLGTAYILLTLALVALVSVVFRDSPYHWCFAFLIVAVLWSLLGAVAGYFKLGFRPIDWLSALGPGFWLIRH